MQALTTRSKRRLVLRLRVYRCARQMARLSKSMSLMEDSGDDDSADYKHMTSLFHEAQHGFADARYELSVLQGSYTNYACETASERPAQGAA